MNDWKTVSPNALPRGSILGSLTTYNLDHTTSFSPQDERINVLSKLLKDKGYELVLDDDPDIIREILERAGNKIGSVQFIKRSNGELRKMSYRLHVTNPKHAKKPSGGHNRKVSDYKNDLMTVFDTNKVVRNPFGEITGRGAWRTIPLENVTKIVAGGKKYLIMPDV